MSKAQQRPAADLFNNSLLSDIDIKIKQVSSDGKIREYYAHKAVLSSDSRYFYKAFTGNFREATEAEMTIHDDDPDHFEFFLKFLYTHNYDKAKLDELAEENPVQRAKIPCEIHAFADKYDVSILNEPIAKDIEELLAEKTSDTLNLLQEVIRAYYKGLSSADGPLSNICVSKIRTCYTDFLKSEQYVSLVKTYPIFGADMALSENKVHMESKVSNYSCSSCGLSCFVDLSALRAKRLSAFYCSGCARYCSLINLRQTDTGVRGQCVL